MYLVNYRLNRLENAVYSILLLYILSQFLVVADVVSLVKHQFQCVSHVGYELCLYPEQYCHTGGYLSQCRPCSKSVCDKLHDADFPLQCRYNCSISLEKTKEVSILVFLTERAILWFSGLVTLLVFNILTCAFIPVWKLWLKELLKGGTSHPKAGQEEVVLIEKINGDDQPIEEKNAEVDESTDKVTIMEKDANAFSQSYCQQKLKNVNPTETDDVEDTKNRVVTARARLNDENTKAKLPRADTIPLRCEV